MSQRAGRPSTVGHLSKPNALAMCKTPRTMCIHKFVYEHVFIISKMRSSNTRTVDVLESAVAGSGPFCLPARRAKRAARQRHRSSQTRDSDLTANVKQHGAERAHQCIHTHPHTLTHTLQLEHALHGQACRWACAWKLKRRTKRLRANESKKHAVESRPSPARAHAP